MRATMILRIHLSFMRDSALIPFPIAVLITPMIKFAPAPNAAESIAGPGFRPILASF